MDTVCISPQLDNLDICESSLRAEIHVQVENEMKTKPILGHEWLEWRTKQATTLVFLNAALYPERKKSYRNKTILKAKKQQQQKRKRMKKPRNNIAKLR